MTAALSDKILHHLASICGTDEVRTDPDLALYEREVLDSMKTIEFIVAMEEEFGLTFRRQNLNAKRGRPRGKSSLIFNTGSTHELDEWKVTAGSRVTGFILPRRCGGAHPYVWPRRFLHAFFCLSGFLSEST